MIIIIIRLSVKYKLINIFLNWGKVCDITNKLGSLFHIQIIDGKNEYLDESTLSAGCMNL